ncbi:MAG TPA: MFS transporter [Flavisolibacter sp.]|jgi:MFS family permease|nr:MFS transporter [Flavisolibacter sp.]
MVQEERFRRRKERLILVIFFFLSGLITATWASRIPDIQQKLNFDNRELGNVLFAIPVGLVIGLLLAGRLVARYGTRRVMFLGCLLLTVMLTLIALSGAAWQLVLSLFFLGFFRTVFNLSINTGAVELQKQYEQPIVSAFHGVWSVACLAAAGLGTLMIINNVLPLWHFVSVAVVAAVLSVLLIRKEKSLPPEHERRPFFVKPDRYLFYLGLLALCAMLCESAVFDWSVNYFEKVVRAEKAYVTAGYTCFIAAMSLGRLFGDRLIARFGIYLMLSVSGLLLATGFLMVSLLPFPITASFGFLLIGAGDAMLVPMIYMLASQSSKMTSHYALQAVTLIGYTGFLVGPLFIGNVSQHWGMATAFLFLSGASLVILLLTVQVKKLAVKA